MLIYSMSVSIGGTLYFAKAPAWLKAGTTTTIALRYFEANDRESAQWVFECTSGGTRASFEGCTVSSSTGGLISSPREYQATGELYDWVGSWR